MSNRQRLTQASLPYSEEATTNLSTSIADARARRLHALDHNPDFSSTLQKIEESLLRHIREIELKYAVFHRHLNLEEGLRARVQTPPEPTSEDRSEQRLYREAPSLREDTVVHSTPHTVLSQSPATATDLQHSPPTGPSAISLRLTSPQLRQNVTTIPSPGDVGVVTIQLDILTSPRAPPLNTELQRQSEVERSEHLSNSLSVSQAGGPAESQPCLGALNPSPHHSNVHPPNQSAASPVTSGVSVPPLNLTRLHVTTSGEPDPRRETTSDHTTWVDEMLEEVRVPRQRVQRRPSRLAPPQLSPPHPPTPRPAATSPVAADLRRRSTPSQLPASPETWRHVQARPNQPFQPLSPPPPLTPRPAANSSIAADLRQRRATAQLTVPPETWRHVEERPAQPHSRNLATHRGITQVTRSIPAAESPADNGELWSQAPSVDMNDTGSFLVSPQHSHLSFLHGSAPTQDIYSIEANQTQGSAPVEDHPMTALSVGTGTQDVMLPLPEPGARLPVTSADTTLILSESESSNGGRQWLLGVTPNGRLRRSMMGWVERMRLRDELFRESRRLWHEYMEYLAETAPSLRDDLTFLGLTYYMRRQGRDESPRANPSQGCRVCSNTKLLVYEEATSAYDCCPICLERFTPQTIVRELHCQHIFHVLCIDQWLKDHSACPSCRKEIAAPPINTTHIPDS